jgi:hypothetical protein
LFTTAAPRFPAMRIAPTARATSAAAPAGVAPPPAVTADIGTTPGRPPPHRDHGLDAGLHAALDEPAPCPAEFGDTFDGLLMRGGFGSVDGGADDVLRARDRVPCQLLDAVDGPRTRSLPALFKRR